MKNTALAAALLILFSYAAHAQSASSAAGQTVILKLTDAIEISFVSNNNIVGPDVTLPFTSVNTYANGVESAAQELKVRSNKDFTVTVKSNNQNFTYTGSATPAPVMPVQNVLSLMVSGNNTGGSIVSPFNNTSYSTIKSTNQNLINYGSKGGNQTFMVKYKATPGFVYPSGVYSVNVLYTATQS